MAVGDGGFATKPMGFDKNEVNEYISNLRKRMQEIEADKKLNDEKTQAALKSADEAKKKIEELQKELMATSTEYDVKLKTAQRNNDQLQNQIDDLKRKLKNASKSGGGNADKQSEQIINNANARANEIIANAQRTANELIASSGASSSGASESFISAARGFIEQINSAFSALSGQAVTIPAPAAVKPAPVAPATVAPVAPAPAAVSPSNEDMFGFNAFGNEDISSLDEGGSDDDMGLLGGFSELSADDLSNKATFDADFTAQLLSQSEGVEDIPDNSGDFDIQPLNGLDSGASGIDAMNDLLAQATAAFGGSGGSMQFDEPQQQDMGAVDNPWASMQAELNSMNQGGFGGDFGQQDSMDNSFIEADPQVPDADSSAIWDFGSDDNSNNDSDDDMSADLFNLS